MTKTIGDLRRFDTCWRYFNPPRRLQETTLDDYKADTKQQVTALNACKEYNIDKIKTGIGLFLFGPVGTGKTHLAVSAVRELMATDPEAFGIRERQGAIYDHTQEIYQGLTCSFFSVVDLLDAMRPGNELKQELGAWLFHRAKADDLVVLDDIGAERVTEWVEERLYAIIDVRYRMQRATILTSNLKEKELEDSLGERIVSRIYEMTEPLPVIGQDYRKKKNS